MATMMGGEGTLADLLNGLIELEQDAIEAYQAAVARVADLRDRTRLVGFLDDHLHHMQDLSALVRELGAEPAGSGDLREILAKGKVVIGGLLGDRLVLEAMKANEADTIAAYERAAERSLPPRARALIEQHLADERRHHDGIVERLDAAEGLLRL